MRGLYLAAVGVVLSTAFVHVMLPAFHIFDDDCFPEFFKAYEGWPAVLILFGFLLTHLVHLFTSSKSKEYEPVEGKFALVTVEMGIAIHSVIIGMSLGLAGEEYFAILVALSIHQFFEGIAVASVVMQVEFKRARTGLLVAGIFVLSTPTGALIGLMIKLFSSGSNSTLLLIRGFLDSLSAGILIYSSIVDLLGPYFMSAEYVLSSLQLKFIDFINLWLGCAIMAVLAFWI